MRTAGSSSRGVGTEIEVGFNATRRYRDGKLVDIALLVFGMVVLVVLLGWGFGLVG